jgi:hypothetical protein
MMYEAEAEEQFPEGFWWDLHCKDCFPHRYEAVKGHKTAIACSATSKQETEALLNNSMNYEFTPNTQLWGLPDFQTQQVIFGFSNIEAEYVRAFRLVCEL